MINTIENRSTVKRAVAHKVILYIIQQQPGIKLLSLEYNIAIGIKRRKMTLPLMYLLAIIITVVAVPATGAQSCNACKCQFNNIEMLSHFIQDEVNRILADEPCKLQQ